MTAKPSASLLKNIAGPTMDNEKLSRLINVFLNEEKLIIGVSE
jgi:hypothetical protein